MANDITFKLDQSGVAEILKRNSDLQNLMSMAIEGTVSIVEAQFFQDFGVNGHFEVVGFTTDRSSYKIQASDKKTAYILKSKPKWLDQFTDNIKI